MLDGKVVFDKMKEYQPPERKETAIEIEQYDWYMVPAEKYEAVSNVKTCTDFVDKNKLTRDSDGYVEMENVATYHMGIVRNDYH